MQVLMFVVRLPRIAHSRLRADNALGSVVKLKYKS